MEERSLKFDPSYVTVNENQDVMLSVIDNFGFELRTVKDLDYIKFEKFNPQSNQYEEIPQEGGFYQLIQQTSNATLDYDGIYRLVYKFKNSTEKSTDATLKIIPLDRSLKVVLPSKNINIDENLPINIDIEVNGAVNCVLQKLNAKNNDWELNSYIQIPTELVKQSIAVPISPAASINDSGQYRFNVRNNDGDTFISDILTINVKLLDKEVIFDSFSELVEFNQPADSNFSITVSAQNAFNYKWEKLINGQWVSLEGSNYNTLTTNELVKDSDLGQYRCIASNSLHSATSKTITVQYRKSLDPNALAFIDILPDLSNTELEPFSVDLKAQNYTSYSLWKEITPNNWVISDKIVKESNSDSFKNMLEEDSGNYRFSISDGKNTIYSNVFKITITKDTPPNLQSVSLSANGLFMDKGHIYKLSDVIRGIKKFSIRNYISFSPMGLNQKFPQLIRFEAVLLSVNDGINYKPNIGYDFGNLDFSFDFSDTPANVNHLVYKVILQFENFQYFENTLDITFLH